MNFDSDDIAKLVKAAERIGRLALLLFWIILVFAICYAFIFSANVIAEYNARIFLSELFSEVARTE